MHRMEGGNLALRVHERDAMPARGMQLEFCDDDIERARRVDALYLSVSPTWSRDASKQHSLIQQPLAASTTDHPAQSIGGEGVTHTATRLLVCSVYVRKGPIVLCLTPERLHTHCTALRTHCPALQATHFTGTPSFGAVRAPCPLHVRKASRECTTCSASCVCVGGGGGVCVCACDEGRRCVYVRVMRGCGVCKHEGRCVRVCVCVCDEV